MDPRSRAEKVLRELHYDFRSFSIEHFIYWIGGLRERQIISSPFKMPAGMFGAWFTDDEEPREYIFYRDNSPKIHQIHIQLHELAHMLLGHSTFPINRRSIVEALEGRLELPFNKLVLQRTSDRSELEEKECETLATIIQEMVIRNSQLEQLTSGISSHENIAQYLKDLGMV